MPALSLGLSQNLHVSTIQQLMLTLGTAAPFKFWCGRVYGYAFRAFPTFRVLSNPSLKSWLSSPAVVPHQSLTLCLPHPLVPDTDLTEGICCLGLESGLGAAWSVPAVTWD